MASSAVRLIVLIACAGLLIACGNGAGDPAGEGQPTAPDNATAKGDETTPRGAGRDDDEPDFGFGLPVGDDDVQDTEVAMYNLLRTRQCGQAQRTLDEGAWRRLTSQRDVLLFQAGIHLCRGDVRAATPWYLRTTAELAGIGSTRNLCQLYKAVASVVEQRPRHRFPCDRGEPPEWPPDGPNGRDDPRTEVDEGAIVPSDEAVPSDNAVPPDEASPDGVSESDGG